MKAVVVFLVVFLVTACGNFRLQSQWPAKVVSYENFNADQQKAITEALTDMNKRSPKTVVSLTDNGQKAYPISIKITDFAAQGFTERAGQATAAGSDCKIELNSSLFTPSRKAYLESVLTHEMGHCAGLPHFTGDSDDMMYPSTQPMDNYSDDELSTFFARLFKSISDIAGAPIGSHTQG